VEASAALLGPGRLLSASDERELCLSGPEDSESPTDASLCPRELPLAKALRVIDAFGRLTLGLERFGGSGGGWLATLEFAEGDLARLFVVGDSRCNVC
jgi:hypothetical protein